MEGNHDVTTLTMPLPRQDASGPPPDRVFSEQELADHFGVCLRTIQRMHLPFAKVGRLRYYPWARVAEELRRRAK